MDIPKILIVEDDRLAAKNFEYLLKRMKYKAPDLAVSGEEAIEKAEKNKIDLILMDINLSSGLNGIEAAKEIKKNMDIPIIYLTAYATEDVIELARNTEPYGYLIKPVEEIELKAAIEMALYKNKAEQRIKSNEEYLYLVLENSTIPTIVISPDHKIKYWNKACEKLTGIQANHVIGTNEQWKAFYDYQRPILADLVIDKPGIDRIEELYSGKYKKSSLIDGAIEAEDFFPHFGKTGKWLFFTAAPLYDSEGNLKGAIETLKDITDRKKVELSLKESENHLTTITSIAKDAIIEIDNNDIITFWNKAAERIFGYKQREALGRNFYSLIEPKLNAFDILGQDEVGIEKNLAKYDKLTIELNVVNKHGHELTIEFSISSAKRKGKRYYVMIARDVTEKKRNQDIIIAHRDLATELGKINNLNELLDIYLKYAIEISGLDAGRIFLKDNHGDFNLQSWMGVGKEENRNVEFFASDSQQAKVINEGFPVYADARQIKSIYKEYIISKNLRSLAMLPIIDEGKVIGFLVLISKMMKTIPPQTRDALETASSLVGSVITRIKRSQELKESEKQYRLVVENANDAIIIIQDEKIRFSNYRSKKLTGLSSEEILNRNFTDFIHPEDRELVFDRYTRRIRGDENIENNYTFRIVHKSGQEIWVELHAVVINWKGAPASLSFLTDITERKKLEKERERSVKILMEMERQKHQSSRMIEKSARLASIGVLAGGITHEINQPLNAIKMGSDSIVLWDEMNKNVLPSRIIQMLKGISDSAQRIDEIIKYMRSVWIDTDKEGMNVIDLNEAINNAIEFNRQRLQAHGIELKTELMSEKLYISANQVQLELVVNNLILNAVQAIDEADRYDKYIEMKTFVKDDMAFFTITDSGNGLPDVQQDKLFDPFYSTKKEKGGTGLGLAIVKMFLDRFRADISARNVDTIGAEFIISFALNNSEYENENTDS